MHLDEALRLPPGFEPAHASLPFARRLMRVLGPVVQVSMLPVCHAGHHDPLRRRVAAQLVGYDHSRTTTAVGLQQLAEEPHSRKAVALRLDQISITTPC